MQTECPCIFREARFELRYRGPFDRLSERSRVNRLHARATVGVELAKPTVVLAVL